VLKGRYTVAPDVPTGLGIESLITELMSESDADETGLRCGKGTGWFSRWVLGWRTNRGSNNE